MNSRIYILCQSYATGKERGRFFLLFFSVCARLPAAVPRSFFGEKLSSSLPTQKKFRRTAFFKSLM